MVSKPDHGSVGVIILNVSTRVRRGGKIGRQRRRCLEPQSISQQIKIIFKVALKMYIHEEVGLLAAAGGPWNIVSRQEPSLSLEAWVDRRQGNYKYQEIGPIVQQGSA